MGWNHHGCQLSKSSESFVLNQNQMSTIFCWSPRIPVNEFFVGDDDEKESNMQGSLWLRAYWGLLRREWLTAQVFLLADSISASATPIHTTNHSIFCSPSLQIRNEMWQYEQHWDILSIYSSLLLPPSCLQLKSFLLESTPTGSCHIQKSTNDFHFNSSVVFSIIN